MIIQSIYHSMEISAEMIPAHTNIKLLLRHSIRISINKSNDPDDLLLTREGIIMAQSFGKNIQYSIGKVYSSHFRRCVQTVEQILIGRNQYRVIHTDECLSSSFVCLNDIEGQIAISKLGIKRTVCLLASGIHIAGINTLNYCVRRILDFIFSSGNTVDTLDIYCTHDLHIAMVNASMFGISQLDEVRGNWPYMLEGIYLWGKREDFYVAWRGQTKRMKNFLI